MTAKQFICSFAHLPFSTEKPGLRASKSEIHRWLEKGSVTINGARPKPTDPVAFPVTELVFFKGAKRQTTF